MDKIKNFTTLVVGGTYRNRLGQVIDGLELIADSVGVYPYMCSRGSTYTSEGYFQSSDTPRPEDLIELVLPAACPTCGETPKATCESECLDVLTAHVEAMPEPATQAYTIAPLKWSIGKSGGRHKGSKVWMCSPIHNDYSIIDLNTRRDIYAPHVQEGFEATIDHLFDLEHKCFPTLEEAQAYCQQHHEAEVKKFLLPA